MRFLVALALVAGCGDDNEGGKDTSGGDLDTSSGDVVECAVTTLAIVPEDGATGVYYRDPLVVSFEGDASAEATISLVDASGAETAVTPTWGEGGVQATMDVVLEPSTTYTLTVDVCDATTTATFTTSDLGTPLTVASADLQGRTYVFRLSEADITEPAFLDVIADSYLNVPLLLGITAADDTSIDILGALGTLNDDGSYTQNMAQLTWDFPAADFTTRPFFFAQAEYIVLSYQGTPIPIEDFTIEGTFTADGTAIMEGRATGLGDSRELGQMIFGDDDPAAICNLAEDQGVYCVPCADGGPYCLEIVAEDIVATWEEGLVVTAVVE